jgi:hypothetical protein
MQISHHGPDFPHSLQSTGEAEMALISNQPLSISGSGPFDLEPRSSVPRENDRGGQNAKIADKLRQGADPFRIAAYRKAAESIRILNDDLGAIAERGGREALEAVPGIGTSIASAIAEMLTTGRWRFLEHLKGSASAPARIPRIPRV